MRADLLSVIGLGKPMGHRNGAQRRLWVAEAEEDPCQKFRCVANLLGEHQKSCIKIALVLCVCVSVCATCGSSILCIPDKSIKKVPSLL